MFAEPIRLTLTAGAGREEFTFRFGVACLRFPGTHARGITVYNGYGESNPEAFVRPWEVRDVVLSSVTDSITLVWGVSPNAQVDTAVVEFVASSGFMQTTGGQASAVALEQEPDGDPPTFWGAAGNGLATMDNVGLVALAFPDPANPSFVIPWDGVPQQLPTFATMFKRSTRDYTTNVAFGGPGRTVLASLWLPTALMYLRLLEVRAVVVETTAAVEVWLDLMRITTQPTGGSSLTPKAFAPPDSSVVEARRLPSGGAAESGDPLGSAFYKLGVTGAVSVVNPAPAPEWQTLYKRSWENERLPYCTQNAGFAIVGDVNAAATVRFAFQMKWIEEGV